MGKYSKQDNVNVDDLIESLDSAKDLAVTLFDTPAFQTADKLMDGAFSDELSTLVKRIEKTRDKAQVAFEAASLANELLGDSFEYEKWMTEVDELVHFVNTSVYRVDATINLARERIDQGRDLYFRRMETVADKLFDDLIAPENR